HDDGAHVDQGLDGESTGFSASDRIWPHRIDAITATLTPAATNQRTCSSDTAPRSRVGAVPSRESPLLRRRSQPVATSMPRYSWWVAAVVSMWICCMDVVSLSFTRSSGPDRSPAP